MTTNKKYLIEKKPGKTQAFFICVVIASFLWLIHALNTVYTQVFKIPVEFKNLPSNKKPLTKLPEFINVNVKASGLKLTFIQLNEPFKPLEIDFNNLYSVHKNQNYVLSSSHLNFEHVFAFETEIKSINPDTLYFTEKGSYQKTVPIKVPLNIKCSEGYSYNRPIITPSVITIWGDTNLIENTDTIYTQAIELSNVSQNINSNLKLLKPNDNIHISSNETSVFIEVAQLIEQTIFVPVTDIQPANKQQVNIFPAKVSVRFTNVQNSFLKKDTVLFKAVINSQKTNASTKKCYVSLSETPENVNVLDIDPKEVEVLILKSKW